MEYNKLNQKEEDVVVRKGTEKPFSGEYDDFFEEGVYLCRKCNSPLYESDNKLNVHCGWPSFDDEFKDAVTRTTDPDGKRVKISCSNCSTHLGHVFEGEGFTLKNMRHCVNSLSLRFIPKEFKTNKKRTIVLGGGCFWCLDATYRMIKGIDEVISGYAGGSKENPTYEEVLSRSTGHAEVIKLTYDPKIITFREILEVFFLIHDPTTLNRQGDDIGEQYRSIILYLTWGQKEEAEIIIKGLIGYFSNPIITELDPLITFYPAEEYHQNYYTKNKEKPYCQMVVAPKLDKLTRNFNKLIRE